MFAAAFARDIFPFPLQIASDDEKLNTRTRKSWKKGFIIPRELSLVERGCEFEFEYELPWKSNRVIYSAKNWLENAMLTEMV